MYLIYKASLFLFLISSMSSCINANKYGFVNEIDGAYIVAKDIITPDKPTTGCGSLSKTKKQECLQESKNLLKAINSHSNKN